VSSSKVLAWRRRSVTDESHFSGSKLDALHITLHWKNRSVSWARAPCPLTLVFS